MPAGIGKVNPSAVTTDFVNGPNLHFVTIDFGTDVSAKTTATSTLQAVMTAVAERNTIYAVGPLHQSNQQITMAVEAVGGRYGTDTYDGTNSETFAADLQDRIRALGTVDSINLNTTTVLVVSTKLGIARAAAIAI